MGCWTPLAAWLFERLFTVMSLMLSGSLDWPGSWIDWMLSLAGLRVLGCPLPRLPAFLWWLDVLCICWMRNFCTWLEDAADAYDEPITLP